MARSPAVVPPSTITVMVADDHGVVRDGLVALIDAQRDMAVTATASSAARAVERARAVRPEVAVLDLLMPGGGIRALRAIRGDCPDTKVLVLSVLDDAEHVKACFAHGAAGYLQKRSAAGELLNAIREVRSGNARVGLTPADRHEPPEEAQRPRAETMGALSRREIEVLRRLAGGYTHKEIGEQLGLSKKTVDAYRARIQKKLQVHGRPELVRFAIAAGFFGNPVE